MPKQANRQTSATVLLNGPNIYHGKKNQVLYYQQRTDTAYIIEPQNERTFKLLQFRYILAVILFIFLYILFKLNIFICLGAAAISAIFLEWRWRKFLKGLNVQQGFMPKKHKNALDQMINKSYAALFLRVFLYLLLAVLIVVNAYVSTNVSGNIVLVAASYAISVIAAFMCIRYIMLIIKKSRE